MKLDILNRDVFINQLLRLIESISDKKVSTSFAIDGAWGCGKSFVLDMLEEQMSVVQLEETGKERYFIIRYNSWKYDYYDEPLIAIVATLIAMIEEKTKLFPDSKEKSEIIGMLKATGVALLSIGNSALKAKTGLDIQRAYETVKKGEKEGAIEYEKKHDYDVYFGFNKVMEKLAVLLQGLAMEYTVVIIVDELDRCIPEYAIKVLERLHHLTDGLSNVITIISIDKVQLLSSVKQTFGFENPEKYMEKFINFELKLDYGSISEKITEKYADYMALFDNKALNFEESIEEFIQAIYKDIDIRTQEQTIKKAMIAHKLLYSEKKDYVFMCMELLLVVMICVYKDTSCFSDTPIDVSSFDKVFTPTSNIVKPAFSDFFAEQFEKIRFRTQRGFSDEPFCYILPEKMSLYGAILFCWYWMHPKSKHVIIQYITKGVYTPIANYYEELKKFAELINMMK